MNKITRKLALVFAALLLVGALSGCGRTKVSLETYPTTVVATFGDTKIYLDEANYKARADQYTNEMYYSMYGYSLTDMWKSDLGTGMTLEDYVKTSTMTAIYQTYVLKAKAEELGLTLDDADKAKIESTVTAAMEGVDSSVLDATNITAERLTEIVTDNALAMKAYEYAVKDVDTEVSDEEAAQRTIKYILVKDGGEDAEAAAAKAEELKGKVEAGEDMSALAEGDDNCMYSTATYGEGDYDNTLGNLGLTLKTGETGMAYDEGYGWYIVYCETDFDEEATQNEKPSIVQKRKDEAFQAVYAEWVKEMPAFKVDEKIWSQITFDKNLYVAPETTAAEEGETTTEEEMTKTGESAEETTAEGTTAAAE